MRFYLNPCFTRFSFDKTDKRRMPQMDHNFNQSCEQSSNESMEGRKLNNSVNHEKFDVEDELYKPEDSLNIEFPGRPNKNKKKRKLRVILCFVSVILLLILACVTTYAITNAKNKQGNKKTRFIETSAKTTDSGKEKKEEKSKGENQNGECNTARCKLIAENLKRSMNFSVDPCDDFHEYSCGRWSEVHPLPASLSKLDTIGLLTLKKDSYIKTLIDSLPNNVTGFKNKILKFYKSCRNLELIDKRGNSPLLKFISKFGKWSPINSETQAGENNLDISSLIILSHQYFSLSVYNDRVNSPLFKAMVKVNDANSNQHILQVSESTCEHFNMSMLQEMIFTDFRIRHKIKNNF